MALITCLDCGREVSDLAPACPNCGRPMAGQEAPDPEEGGQVRKNPFETALLICLALTPVVAFVFLAVRGLDGRASGGFSSNSPDASLAQAMCGEFVREYLRAPATADFQHDLGSAERGPGPDEWFATVVVDAENAFGANIRERHRCAMRYEPGNDQWELMSLTGAGR